MLALARDTANRDKVETDSATSALTEEISEENEKYEVNELLAVVLGSL
ncbi:MAG: hypothetical protein ACR2NU_09735 [Aeoliella sp.]